MIPAYWMNETSGQLEGPTRRFLAQEALTTSDLTLIKLYLTQWMLGPWMGEGVDELRLSIGAIATRSDLENWLERARERGIDPF